MQMAYPRSAAGLRWYNGETEWPSDTGSIYLQADTGVKGQPILSYGLSTACRTSATGRHVNPRPVIASNIA